MPVFLLTDIEGSTRLWDTHHQAMLSALLQHNTILEAQISRYGGRILELRGQPISLLRKIAHQDEDVEDVQAFGDRLHVRVGQNKAEVVLSRLKLRIGSEGGEVSDLRSVHPGLEDVFIALSEGIHD